MRTTLYVIAKAKFEATYLSIPRLLPITLWDSMLAQGQSKSLDVLEAIEELEDVKFEGEFVIPSGAIARVILECFKADCVKSEYEIEATDFFFADLTANPPNLNGISAEVQKAWSLFLKVVDTSVIYRHSLPWWLYEAARARSAYVGLLTPAESRLVTDLHSELYQLIANTKNSDLECQDVTQLLEVISQATLSGDYVLGWEFGT